MANLILARMVNSYLGGALVGPYDVGQLDEVTLDAIRELAVGLPGLQRAYQQLESIFERRRKEHPTYRK